MEEAEALYLGVKSRLEREGALTPESFTKISGDLQRVANEAEDAHLRANASLLLGSLHDEKGDRRAALSFYRQAKELVPDDPSTHAVLAFTLADLERWDEAITEQLAVVELAPDDLTGWLLLGEMYIKAGKMDEAPNAYAAYELRRHGLLEGLTAKLEGAYVKDPEHRAACAEALAPAADNGTALALMYAFESDPEAIVRANLAAVMGEQRLVGYKEFLTKHVATEQDADVKEALEWAISEIERDPVDTTPGAVPKDIQDAVTAREKELAAEAAEEAAGEPGADAGEEAAEQPAGDAAGESGPEAKPESKPDSKPDSKPESKPGADPKAG
ncbi:Tetratricopeptide repeat protein [Plesiocystis pacifica SIR-1]|uniref:Tetratricopeptide repeat protein n=2 Tax=Plesiocystis pacifica TaxID=191768 RepID=A6GJ67_9BACT|nr:Tetratricopeptide repeat protein [Plesiocystis pacifica SIR-1]